MYQIVLIRISKWTKNLAFQPGRPKEMTCLKYVLSSIGKAGDSRHIKVGKLYAWPFRIPCKPCWTHLQCRAFLFCENKVTTFCLDTPLPDCTNLSTCAPMPSALHILPSRFRTGNIDCLGLVLTRNSSRSAVGGLIASSEASFHLKSLFAYQELQSSKKLVGATFFRMISGQLWNGFLCWCHFWSCGLDG